LIHISPENFRDTEAVLGRGTSMGLDVSAAPTTFTPNHHHRQLALGLSN
jgi:hypothetical protein